MWGIIATWTMAEKGIKKAGEALQRNVKAIDAAEICVNDVESNPEFISVGYGGLPNKVGIVTLDAAVMDGDTLSFGAVASVKNYENPCSIAKTLVDNKFNNYLVADGAELYAEEKGFVKKELLTDKSKGLWIEHQKNVQAGLNPYNGHDTVCAVSLDQNHSMATVTSTSGLFYKKPGRVGDASIIGSGYYVDSEIGGAVATGLGEDIMKGLTSYEIVRMMSEDFTPQEACERAVERLHRLLIKRRGHAGDISVVAMNTEGEYGVATNIEAFPFIAMTEKYGFIQGLAKYNQGKFSVEVLND